jgi:hypothetical protein
MKNIWLMGGLGNVLFQILAFNIISKTSEKVFYVKTLTEKNHITKFLGWTIHQNLYNNLIEKKQFNEMKLSKSSIIVLISFLSKKMQLKFKSATFYSSSIQITDYTSNHVFGYFQDKTFLKMHKKELLELGGLLNFNYAMEEKKPIVVHYRKGDSDWAIRSSYYYNEIKEMLKKESLPILIVTDSINEARVFFNDVKNTKILQSSNALDDFQYLVSSDKLYCAPSTFSWWAAHSSDENSELVMPNFFRDTLGIYVKNDKVTII